MATVTIIIEDKPAGIALISCLMAPKLTPDAEMTNAQLLGVATLRSLAALQRTLAATIDHSQN